MSFFGDLLKFAATAALFIATGPFSLSVSAFLATALRIGGVALYYLSSLVDKSSVALERQMLMFRTSLQPGTPIPVVYGTSKVGAVIADWFLEPVAGEQLLYMQAVLCHGSQSGEPIDAIESIWLNNTLAVTTGATVAITSSSVAAATLITTGAAHGLDPGDYVIISGHTGAVTVPAAANVSVNGLHLVLTTPLTTTFTIGVNVSTGGTGGTVYHDEREHPYHEILVDYQYFLGSDSQNIATTQLLGLRPATTGGIWRIMPPKSPVEVVDSGWEDTAAGAGLAAISFRLMNLLVFDPPGQQETTKPGFPSGPPSVAAIVSGVQIFDTRDDTWYPGGSNPAFCVRDYLMSSIYGCGLDLALIDTDSFEDAADYCDELAEFLVGEVDVTSSSVANPSVITTTTAHGFETGDTVRIAGHTSVTPDINTDYTVTVTGESTFTIPVNVTDGGVGGTATRVVEQERFTCNGVVDTGQSTASNLQELLSSCRGQLVWEQGKFKLRIRSEDVAAPSVTLTPSEILGQWSFRRGGLSDQYNLVTAAYIEPADGQFKAQQVQWPEVGTTNSYLTADGSFVNRLDLSLPFTNDPVMAMGIAQVVLKESRASLACSVLCTEAALALSVGDRCYVTHPTPEWSAKEFWVAALDVMPNHTVSVSLQEYDATAYTLGTLPKPPTITPRTPQLPTEDRFSPKVRVKGAFPTFVSTRLFVSWESNAASAKIAVSTSDFPAVETGSVVGGTGANYDLGLTTAEIYYYVTITPYTGESATGVPGEAQYLRVLRSASDPGAPTLTAVGRGASGGDFCTSSETWNHTVSWTVTSPNDAYYHTKIEYADNSAGTNWASLVDNLTTFSSEYVDDTLIAGNTGGSTGAVTYYRIYRVSIIRKSDSATIDGPDSTSQGTLTTYTDACA